MKRFYAASLLKAALKPDAVVVCGMGATSWAWREQKAPQPTYYVTDPMGMAMSMALGMALAQPKRQVVLLDGDDQAQRVNRHQNGNPGGGDAGGVESSSFSGKCSPDGVQRLLMLVQSKP